MFDKTAPGWRELYAEMRALVTTVANDALEHEDVARMQQALAGATPEAIAAAVMSLIGMAGALVGIDDSESWADYCVIHESIEL